MLINSGVLIMTSHALAIILDILVMSINVQTTSNRVLIVIIGILLIGVVIASIISLHRESSKKECKITNQ